MKRPVRSQKLFAQATQVLPGGVDSPVRAFQAVGGQPLFAKRGSGAILEDVDGNRFIDYVMSWGPLIHGHAPSGLVRAISAAARSGTSFGAPCALEHELGERVRTLMPSVERVRFVSSGTEAGMSAIRVARAFTGRSRIIKFAGCYHGHADAFLVKAGSGAMTLGIPTSPGVPPAVSADTLIARYNDLASVDALLDAHGSSVAALIVEPIAGNIGVVAPADGFLAGLRERCTRHGIVLIFDEVISGFRAAAGGAQAIFGIKPDMTCLGKIIGGGLPVGAYGGRADIMELVAPAGPVYQAGTLSGNPLAVTAGLVVLDEISKPGFHDALSQHTTDLLHGLKTLAHKAGIPFSTTQVGGMFGCYFNTEPNITTFAQVMQSDVEMFRQYFHLMLSKGVYLAPSAFEAGFLSAAHGPAEIRHTLEAAEKAFAALGKAA